jgi:DNA-binding NarL/FixJ family response regulator
VSDLFLRVKIEGLARAEGLSCRLFAVPDGLLQALAGGEGGPSVVIVDLGAAGDAGFALLEALAGREPAPPTLAFFSHVDTEARHRALAAGATRVVPRSALVARFGVLVRELGAPAGGG